MIMKKQSRVYKFRRSTALRARFDRRKGSGGWSATAKVVVLAEELAMGGAEELTTGGAAGCVGVVVAGGGSSSSSLTGDGCMGIVCLVGTLPPSMFEAAEESIARI